MTELHTTNDLNFGQLIQIRSPAQLCTWAMTVSPRTTLSATELIIRVLCSVGEKLAGILEFIEQLKAIFRYARSEHIRMLRTHSP